MLASRPFLGQLLLILASSTAVPADFREIRMKMLHVAIAALAVPVCLSAQQTAATPPVNPITTVFRTRTLAQQRNIAQAFDSIPAAKFSYKPTPAQLTIGYVAQHLANDNYFFCNNFGDAKATRPERDTATPDSVKATWPKDSLVAKLKESFAFCETALNQLDDAKLADQITQTFNGNTRQSTRAQFVLGHVADMADHYSQIANYMRLNGLVPPTAQPRRN
ncbi:MAG TPA: DinB family protein [Gemmatimonadaceae bacterium]|nr:DinB family protein [Gemmatimonadaceae bacterium]